MHVLSLNKLWDFMHVIYSMREHYTKVEYFLSIFYYYHLFTAGLEINS
jgi:hypothetical protein